MTTEDVNVDAVKILTMKLLNKVLTIRLSGNNKLSCCYFMFNCVCLLLG